MQEKLKFTIDLILIFLFGVIQSMSLISFLSVKPNLVLSLLVVLSLSSKNFWQYLIFVLIAIISMKYSSLISSDLLIFGAIMLLAYALKKYLTEHIFLASLTLTLLLTVIFYVFLDYSFIFSNFRSFLLELFYNMTVGGILSLLYFQHARQ